MSSNKIPLKFIENLQLLMEGALLNASTFSSKQLLNRFLDDGVLEQIPVGRRRRKIACRSPEALHHYLHQQFGIHSLEEYHELMQLEQRDGADSLRATRSTKTFRTQTLQGFFIKPFGTSVTMNGTALPALPEGVEFFVHDFNALSISESTLVIGIENPECFVKIKTLLHHFPGSEHLFVLRYHSKSPAQWLATISNPYLHFGDFDPAGIAIYHNEYLKPLGETRCRFFVPENIDALIENGDPTLYDQQLHLMPEPSSFLQPDLLALIAKIKQHGRGVEQEHLLAKNDGEH